MSAFRRLCVVLAVAVLLVSGCPAAVDVGSYFDVVAVPIGPAVGKPATIIDIAQAGEQLWVWSVRDGHDELHHSTDGGRHWKALASPPMGGIAGPSYPEVNPGSRILVFGERMVTFRSTSVAPGANVFDSPAKQTVAVSYDGGKSWVVPELAVPTGTSPLVFGADEVDSRLYLLGASQADSLPRRKATPAVLDGGYQAKIWMQDAKGFTSIGADTLKMGHASVATTLIEVGGRLVALGKTGNGICCVVLVSNFSWQSLDEGDSWSPMLGLDGGFVDFFVVTGERLLVHKRFDQPRALESGANRWVKYHGFAPWGDGAVPVGDETVVAVWNEDEACDCSFSYATRYRAGEPFPSGFRGEATRLTFPCLDTSIRGFTAVEPLVDLGSSIAAFATCDDSGRSVGNLVWTMDAGITWKTDKLLVDGKALPADTSKALSLDHAIVVIQLLDGQPTAVRITGR